MVVAVAEFLQRAVVERLLIVADELFPIVEGEGKKQNVFHMRSFLSIA